MVGGELALLSPQHVSGVLPNSVNVHAAFFMGETEAQGATPICPELLSSLQSRGLVPAAQQHPLNVMPTTFYGLTDT